MVELNGEIEIPYTLYRSIEEEFNEKPIHHLISNASYNCICKDGYVSMICNYEIRVFDEKTSGISSSKNKEPIQLISQSATILKSEIKYLNNNNNNGEWVKCNDDIDGGNGDGIYGASILTYGNYYYLHTTNIGKYQIKLELSVPYTTIKEAGMDLLIPKCSNNSVFFSVAHKNANIKVFNSFIDTKSILDWEEKQKKDSLENKNSTFTFVKLANEQLLKAQWTINDEQSNNNNSITPKVIIKPNVTVSQYYYCSIGEGLLSLKCQFDYKIISGTISTLYIDIQDNINIINVEGLAIKKWDVVEYVELKNTEASSSKNSIKKYNKTIQIQLDYGIDNFYSLIINGEHSMGNTSGELSVPSMFCRASEGYLITRQRGFLGVEARTSIEISENSNLQSSGLQIVDVRQLPIELSKMANYPILLSYKFLEAEFNLQLTVKRNKDCAVLVSLCESSHFITTVSYSGKMIHQIILEIKNTQQQFLRIQMPYDFEIWSSMLDGEPIKPSIDQEQSNLVLIPILKPGVFNQNQTIKIEIVLLQLEAHKFNHSSNKGSFKFTIPKIDLKLRSVFATVYLPPGTTTSNYTGNIKNVKSFSSNVPMATIPNGSVVQASNQDILISDCLSGGGLGGGSSLSKIGSRRGKRTGVVPVFVEIPTTNTPVFFEQILIDKELKFAFDYKIKEKDHFRTINFNKLTRNFVMLFSLIALPLTLVCYNYYTKKLIQ